MIYELLYPLRHDARWLGWLNVLRYVPFRVIAATLSANTSTLKSKRMIVFRCRTAHIRCRVALHCFVLRPR